MTAFTPLTFRPRAVIFDMDGLMLDSERAITACLAQAADEQGLTIEPAFWLQMVGTGDVACRLLLGERVGDAAADRMLARAQLLYDAVAERGIPHRPGIIALLEYLVAIGMPRAVATSTQRPLALRKLQAADLLWRFDAVCTASDVRHPKPAPDIYLLAAQSLGVDPAHCLVLEDSPTGVRAALAAGMTPIQIPDLLEPDANVRALGHRIMPSLSDAQRLLEAQLSG
ncbi:hydrolase [Xanthomonas vesicatoria ATCC 35937]|uniref:Haloacid dehalogenase superfamily protein, subfamily IA, variant 3 with third motif having DD or ED n=1 Tax=Xanthomonas vesicatoria ATCC 35937 TaxID=925775 RepID=F0BDC5_9XANT|nr:HAD family phosphatase [Xanthomonas vesicatoria]APP75409.1 hydrolase [Xanthomonas vesicatoria ATCC 35937]EGD09579.1 haloacid dehalogenase superfamily protein, subfamily IA, variant 3 with third motif having DD or ED [Xanthomonas vesicatoria ATCC 35937]KTF33769.1 hydrolase [Xanthomonas vesicatoria]MCC8598443.1 HAD family phosphatase [Xanthomonas vesicatoria]MCC8607028.1 HAD family phosphatase [Xanthomonas vesicatoria]